MPSVTLDTAAVTHVKTVSAYDALYRNDPSHFIAGNGKAEILKLKTYLTTSKQKDSLLYIAVNTPAIIANAYADFVAGKGVIVRINDENAQKAWDAIARANTFSSLMHRMAISQSVVGYAVARVRRDDSKNIIIEEIPHGYYYPQVSDVPLGGSPTAHNIVSRYRKGVKEVLHIQRYEKANQKWVVTAGEYEVGVSGGASGTLFTSYNAIGETAAPEEMDFLALYRAENDKLTGDYFGRSDFVNALDLIEELNDRLTQISVQFIKHLNAKLAVPMSLAGILQNEDKTEADLEMLAFDKGEQPPQYVENGNSLISEAHAHIESIIRLIAASSGVPPSFFGLNDGGGAEKVEAIKLRMNGFLNKVHRKQREFDAMLYRLVRDALTLAGFKNMDALSIETEWPDILPRDMQAESGMYASLRTDGIISTKTAQERIFRWDEAALTKEAERMTEEDQMLRAAQGQASGNLLAPL